MAQSHIQDENPISRMFLNSFRSNNFLRTPRISISAVDSSCVEVPQSNQSHLEVCTRLTILLNSILARNAIEPRKHLFLKTIDVTISSDKPIPLSLSIILSGVSPEFADSVAAASQAFLSSIISPIAVCTDSEYAILTSALSRLVIMTGTTLTVYMFDCADALLEKMTQTLALILQLVMKMNREHAKHVNLGRHGVKRDESTPCRPYSSVPKQSLGAGQLTEEKEPGCESEGSFLQHAQDTGV
ncbi:hypothetical protein M422DRAFT_272880 [Sphaerobolus stellatus SS14]|uniref:Uncharacterized protein n=1 Tax=Sphaerobolus stellatus (strain SS14) TaxID=990650 RepID=A0A0C9UKU5_SPHS4|nr:hypothetical protein M422DRAFT_272880 [Sphaerobolus stellatus SS14]